MKKITSRLKKRIIIQEIKEISDNSGGYTISWINKIILWAEIKTVSGYKKIYADKISDFVTHLFTTRYISDITPKMRIFYDDRVFSIKYVINFMEKNELLQILTEEEIS
ncbi:phage head closure protein [Pseudomonadota bacterium]